MRLAAPPPTKRTLKSVDPYDRYDADQTTNKKLIIGREERDNLGYIGDIIMHTQSIKEQAHRLLDNLRENATWEDLMYRIYVRQAIEAGIKDSDTDKTVDLQEVCERFGLKE